MDLMGGSFLFVYIERLYNKRFSDYHWFTWARAVIGWILVSSSVIICFYNSLFYNKICSKLVHGYDNDVFDYIRDICL